MQSGGSRTPDELTAAAQEPRDFTEVTCSSLHAFALYSSPRGVDLAHKRHSPLLRIRFAQADASVVAPHTAGPRLYGLPRRRLTVCAQGSADSGGYRNSNGPISSIGFLKPRRLRGRSLSSVATHSRSIALWRDRSVPLGKYWRSSPLCSRWYRVATVRAGHRNRCRYPR
jgi:hypothetical protein